MQAAVHPHTFPASHAPRMAPRAAAAKGGPLRSYLSDLSKKQRLPTKAALFSESEVFRSVNLVFSTCAWPRRSARVQAIYDSSYTSSSGWGWSPNGGESFDEAAEFDCSMDEAELEAASQSWQKKLPRVIYEDEDLIAIDKPVGMSFHPTETSPGIMATLSALMSLDQLPGSEYNGPLHVVHTLDEMTSGVLLFAKSEVAAAALVEQFHRGKVHHYFVALSARKPSKTTGTVRGEVARGRKGVFKLTAAKGKGKGKKGGKGGGQGGGSTAVTRFFTTNVTGADGRDLHMLVMKPVTPKRSHQLRSTCKSLGAPVLGDATYVGAKASGEDRAYLHAAAIRIRLPSLPSTLFRAAAAEEEEEEEATTTATTARCDDSDSCTDTCSAGRVIQIVCAPSEGKEWCAGSSFEDAWRSAGFGEAEAGARKWFPGGHGGGLLASSLDDLLADGAADDAAVEEEDMEEVLHVVDGGVIDVSWEVRRSAR